ncbi:MAG: DUF255 domain-containing protein [Tepidisphaera sp.]|nr:DUF255 domain-containing protein [Tepidisphaera sp.]
MAHTNRLAASTSPYLLQHAHNPVDWWPWGEGAIEEARRRDVPLFVSIGYSTCYWCHVMERESFENEQVAAQMNEGFVCVKVDREERPDVDELYMAATVLMNGHGGWPMSVFVEPKSLKPFFCGTYYPLEPRPGVPTFPKVLEAMRNAWRDQREGVVRQAEQLALGVADHLATATPGQELGQSQVADAVAGVLRMFDRANGGFGAAPKFPQCSLIRLLQEVRERAADDSTADAIDIALRTTLNQIMIGGIRDHVGGGFHRYAVDATWTVPHFEKMLYDQAQLLEVFARAARRDGDSEYARAAREVFAYVSREMTSPGGGFYSAQDAEVDGKEGANYVWTVESLREALAPAAVLEFEGTRQAALDALEFATKVYGLDGGPNFRDPHHPGEASNVLRLSGRMEAIAAGFQTSPAALVEKLTRLNAALLEARNGRAQPRRDDKVIAAWNGMMIGALASAGRALEDGAMVAAARRAADWLLGAMVEPKGELMRAWRDGKAHTPGFLEDYASVALGLFEIARCEEGAARAKRVSQGAAMLERGLTLFADEAGGLFDTREGATDLFVRARSTHDGAMPSGTAMMLHALLDGAELVEEAGDAARGERYREAARRAIDAISGHVSSSPVGCAASVRALLRMLLDAESGPGAMRPSSAAEVHTARAVPAQRQHPAAMGVVEIYAAVDRVALRPLEPVEMGVVIKVAEGWHIVAAEPGETAVARAMRPLRIDVVHGQGVKVYADYPAGEDFGEGEQRIKVNTGTIELRVAMERDGAWKGTPILSVAYQACSDTECLEPAVVELDIALDKA